MDYYLTNIDPKQNRYRFYYMTVQPGLFKNFCLIRRWGRVDNKGRSLSRSFETIEELSKEVERLLRTKKRRGYISSQHNSFNINFLVALKL